MPEPTHNNALPIGAMLMEYRLKAVLGAGGFGLTYLANDTNLDKQVAIKEFLPTGMSVRGADGTVAPTSSGHENDFQWGLDRFAKEARTLAKFAHPNIVRVNRFFNANGTGYMVMDFEDGDSLKSWVRQNPGATEADVGALFAPLLDGLEKVHAAGFLHRDIKPENIVVRHSGGPVLIDFGSARQSGGESTQAMTTIVTPGYAPFEQYTQTTRQGPWTDIYALAGSLYFVVTRQNPPDAITRMKDDTVGKVLLQARMNYSKAFIDAIAWGLTVDDKQRARSVPELRDALFGKKPAAQATSDSRAQDSKSVMGQPAGPDILRTRINADAVTTKIAAGAVTTRTAAGAAAALSSSTATGQSGSADARATVRASIAMEQPKEQQQDKPSRMSVRLLGYGFVAVVLLVSGLLLMGGERKPAAPVSPPAPAVKANANANTNALIDAAEIDEAVKDSSATPSEASNATTSPSAGSVAAQGMSREQFVQTYPHLANRFDAIDTNRDGRINVNELIDGMQQFGVK